MRPILGNLIAVCLTVTLLSSCERGPRREVLGGATMGTTWSVIYGQTVTGSEQFAPEDLQALIVTELAAINQALSTYIPDSEISRLNSFAGNDPVSLSPGFLKVLSAALAVGEKTEGAYDVTVGPLIELWGFGATFQESEPPSDAEIRVAKASVGAQSLSLNATDSTLSRPIGVEVDLSSIAKGYAVDQLTELLRAHGITNSLVEIGGELRASGERPEGGPWRLAVESPEPSKARFIEALSVRDAAVATSGDYRNFFEYEGRQYSHLVDPRTGYPVAHELVSVTVVASECMVADAWATALLVLGLDGAKELAQREGLAVHFVSRGAEGLEVHYTEPFNAYRQDTQRREEPQG